MLACAVRVRHPGAVGAFRSGGDTSGFARAALVLGVVLLAAAGGLVLVSGLIMPAWAVGFLGACWLVAVVAAVRWRRRPGVVFALPVGLLALWVAMAWVGDHFWDWSA
jgi:hypothetical protein